MEDKIARRLNWFYYGSYVLACLAATLFWYLVTGQSLSVIEPQSVGGNIMQYVVILYVLVTVPGGLYVFKRVCEKIRKMEETQRYAMYYKWAVVRICVIGLGITLCIIAFYVLGGYVSMIWCAAIAALGLYFCKPTPRKIQLELADNNIH